MFGYEDIARLLVSREAGMKNNEEDAAMVRSAEKGRMAQFLFPFEAGLTNGYMLNYTCCTIAFRSDVIAAVQFEKTAGWLMNGKSITHVMIDERKLSKENQLRISQNPLWRREIELAEYQQRRHEEIHPPDIHSQTQESSSGDELCEFYVPPASQWLPKGI